MLLIHEEIQAAVERRLHSTISEIDRRIFVYPAGNGKYGVQVVWHGFRNKSPSARATWGYELRQELGVWRGSVREVMCRTPDEFVWPDERAFKAAQEVASYPEG